MQEPSSWIELYWGKLNNNSTATRCWLQAGTRWKCVLRMCLFSFGFDVSRNTFESHYESDLGAASCSETCPCSPSDWGPHTGCYGLKQWLVRLCCDLESFTGVLTHPQECEWLGFWLHALCKRLNSFQHKNLKSPKTNITTNFSSIACTVMILLARKVCIHTV